MTNTSLEDREADICRRLREVRVRLKWKMPDFAQQIGITRDRLASYEYARAPVRYWLGRKVCEYFNINQRWLATGDLPWRYYIDLHPAFEQQIKDEMLFSKAYENFLAKPLETELSKIATAHDCRISELDHVEKGIRWPIGEPLEISQAYHGRLLRWALQKKPEEVQKAVYRKLNAVLMEASMNSPNRESKPYVDNIKNSNMIADVSFKVPTWNELVTDLKRLTKNPGAKAQLAKDLSTSRQNVNKWLNGAGAPSAELTLSLLRKWVELRNQK